MNEYDIGRAFRRIENELIKSMIGNLKHHRAEEDKEGFLWSQWQAEQLAALEKYKKENKKKFSGTFAEINGSIDGLIKMARQEGDMDQEESILKAIKKGAKLKKENGKITGEFFKVNDRKLNALVEATTNDFKKAETAVLRRADDQYRKIIFDAQVYANAGGTTYEKAVDMATKDFLSKGIDCIEYKNGSRHSASDYADMAIKTATKRAYLAGEGEKRKEWGISTVIMNKRGNPCPKCLPFCGKVLIDDVWSGGDKNGIDPETKKKYPTMSYAISRGLYHPRCRDSHTTYFPGISTADDTWTKEELEDIGLQAKEETKQQYAKRQAEKFERLAKYSLDEENQKLYESRAGQWRNVRFKTGGLDSRSYAELKRPLANFRAVPQDKAVEVMQKDAEVWLKTLTDEEQRAIRKYTYNSGDKKPNRLFERLNAMLRGEKEEDLALQKYSNLISEALRKNKLSHDVICYRNLDKDVYASKKANDIFREKQFLSTSVIEKGALDKPYKVIIYVKKGTRAGYIEKLSHYEKQKELLLDKNTLFRVVSKRGDVVELEVL